MRESPLLPPPERHVDLGVEEDEEGEGDDAEADEPEPVEVDRVVDVPPQLRRQNDRVSLRICNILIYESFGSPTQQILPPQTNAEVINFTAQSCRSLSAQLFCGAKVNNALGCTRLSNKPPGKGTEGAVGYPSTGPRFNRRLDDPLNNPTNHPSNHPTKGLFSTGGKSPFYF